MSRRTHIPTLLNLLLGTAALVGTFSFLGAVMGETHEPVAIEPDVKLADGIHVATFALG